VQKSVVLIEGLESVDEIDLGISGTVDVIVTTGTKEGILSKVGSYEQSA
jgi:hypothetical protein